MTEQRIIIFFAFFVTLSTKLVLASAAAASSAASSWYGFYEGIDPLDGGTISLSITPADSDDGSGVEDGNNNNNVNLRFSDTFIRGCTSVPSLLPEGFMGSGSEYNKRGIYVADATFPEDNNSPFSFPIPVYCYDESLVPVEINAKINNTIEIDGDTLIMTGPLLPKPDKYVRFHRLSSEMKSDNWDGMYEAIDLLDGGVVALSIGRFDDTESYSLRLRDTFMHSCTALPSDKLPDGWEGAGPPYSKRGIFLAEAETNDDNASLVNTVDGGPLIPINTYCYSGENDVEKPWALYNETVSWSFERTANGMIYVSGTYFDGTDSTLYDGVGGNPNLRFHYVSGSSSETDNNNDIAEGSEDADDEPTSSGNRVLNTMRFVTLCLFWLLGWSLQ